MHVCMCVGGGGGGGRVHTYARVSGVRDGGGGGRVCRMKRGRAEIGRPVCGLTGVRSDRGAVLQGCGLTGVRSDRGAV